MSGLTSARSLIASSRRNLALDGLRFPDDIEKVPHKLVMRFVKRSATQGGRSDLTREEVNRTIGFIVLPVPTQIVDGVSVKYNTTDLGITGEAIAGAAQGISNAVRGLNQGNFLGTILTAGDPVTRTSLGEIGRLVAAGGSAAGAFYGANVLNRVLASAGISNPQAGAALSVGLNKTLNPFTTAVFQGVNLRTFTFSWTLSPKSSTESALLENIIEEIRRRSLPKVPRSTAGLFMEFPDVVEFNLIGMISDQYTFPTSPCVVDTVVFDRTPTGSPVFFAGTGAPAVIGITMKLTEIRPLISDETSNYGVNTNSLLRPTSPSGN